VASTTWTDLISSRLATRRDPSEAIRPGRCGGTSLLVPAAVVRRKRDLGFSARKDRPIRRSTPPRWIPQNLAKCEPLVPREETRLQQATFQRS